MFYFFLFLSLTVSVVKIVKYLLDNKTEEIVTQEIKQDTSTLIGRKQPKVTIEGEQLNISSRYEIFRKVFNLDDRLKELKLKDKQKYELLSIVLNCNETTARHLLNNKQQERTPIQHNLVSFFLNTIE